LDSSDFESKKEREESRRLHSERVLAIKNKLGEKVAKDFDWKWRGNSIPTNKKATKEFERLMALPGERLANVSGQSR
jgi:hypothetical protein